MFPELASEIQILRTQVDKAVTEVARKVKTNRRQSSEHELVRMQHDWARGYRIRPKHQSLQNRIVDGLAADSTDLAAAWENVTEVTM